MNEQSITEFITDYTPESRGRISFAWNQKHGSEFEDSNYGFRKHVIAAIVASPDKASINLLHDLFEAEACWSKEAWCVGQGFSDIGTIMLKRNGIDSLDCFLAWFCNSFDAFSQCHVMQLDPITVDVLLQEVNRRFAAAPKGRDGSYLKMAKELFEKFKKGDPAKGMFVIRCGPGETLKNARAVSKFELWLHRLKSMLIGRK